jgi:hypothetical protein
LGFIEPRNLVINKVGLKRGFRVCGGRGRGAWGERPSLIKATLKEEKEKL